MDIIDVDGSRKVHWFGGYKKRKVETPSHDKIEVPPKNKIEIPSVDEQTL